MARSAASGGLPPRLSDLLDAADSPARDAAWAAFLDEYTKLILSAVRRTSSSYDDVMDRYTFVLDRLQNEDFRRLRVYPGDGRGKFTTWLVVVTRRLCVDYHRKQYGRPRTAAAASDASQLTTRRNLVDLVAAEVDVERLEDDRTPRPDVGVLDADRYRALEAAVGELDVSDQLLLTYRFEDGMSVEKIANLIGARSRFHVHRRLNGILAKLRIALDTQGIGGS